MFRCVWFLLFIGSLALTTRVETPIPLLFLFRQVVVVGSTHADPGLHTAASVFVRWDAAIVAKRPTPALAVDNDDDDNDGMASDAAGSTTGPAGDIEAQLSGFDPIDAAQLPFLHSTTTVSVLWDGTSPHLVSELHFHHDVLSVRRRRHAGAMHSHTSQHTMDPHMS